jgi:hypothetical protein
LLVEEGVLSVTQQHFILEVMGNLEHLDLIVVKDMVLVELLEMVELVQ